MVATKRRMAAAKWKRMMKAKMINMAALLSCRSTEYLTGSFSSCLCLTLDDLQVDRIKVRHIKAICEGET